MDAPPNGRRTVLITGGGSGIGAATARLLSPTWNVAICGRRVESLAAVAGEVGALDVAADIGAADQVQACVERVVAVYGQLDALVINAGVVHAGTVGELTLRDWDATLRTNLTGAFLLAKTAMPHMLKKKGAIVSVSSLAGLRSGPGLSAYAASKAGLIALTQSIALDFGKQGLRANVVCPGWIRTEMADEEMSAVASQHNESVEDAYARVTQFVPQRRPGNPSEVADVIAWLLSPASSYVNGAVISVDGGTAIVDAGTATFLDA
jgi:NAD(P)-dependent dehydrogenase (short-subunit alcohol dehydrogenase family)